MSGPDDIPDTAAEQLFERPLSDRMIHRVTYIRLKNDIGDSAAEIAAHSLTVLGALPGVVAIDIGIPADEHARAAWDLSLTVRFARLEDVDLYTHHPEHRRYMDEYLVPRTHVLKAWSFWVSAAPIAAQGSSSK